MTRRLALPLFLLLTLGGGLLIGTLTPPGDWYEALAKPAFNPPPWLFAPVWTALYAMVGIAGWRVWRKMLGRPVSIWFGQLALNFLWSPVFFAAHLIGWALAVIVALLALCLWFIAATWREDRTAAWLFVPYAAWVAFATLLNGAILMLN
jgi:translocator protein